MSNMQERQLELMNELRKLHDESFYWVDLTRFRHNIATFLSAFQVRYPKTTLAYSYKTNYLPALLKQAHRGGCRAEVVPAMEYDIAKAMGVDPRNIIFNGPVKSEATLRAAFTEGAQLHIDSVSEGRMAVKLLSAKQDLAVRLGIRCNFPVEGNTDSQFGLDPTDPETKHLARTLLETPGARLCGVHGHFSTRGRTVASFRERTEMLIDWADTLIPKDRLSFIDVGGGFFGPMPEVLRKSFGSNVPSFDDYAEAVAGTMARKFGADGPELLVEPGAALVGDVMSFCTSVVALKRARGRVHAIVAGSIQNIRPTGRSTAPFPYHFEHHADAGQSEAVMGADARVMGYTCMETDVILDDFNGPIAVGDRFHFQNMGAYTLVFKPPFIAPAPPIYAFDDDLEPVLVRRAETAHDVLATYIY